MSYSALLARCAACALLTLSVSLAAGESQVSFGRDVLPILSEHCFHCHGPDEATRSTDLRFDDVDSVFGDLGGYSAVVAGSPDESEAIRRILSTDPDEVMPPPEAKMDLSEEAKRVLEAWVRDGADWEEHWAFEPPKREATTGDTADVSAAIDQLVRKRLEAEGLRPSARADRATLVRRVYLALTGLPSAPAEVEAFLADPSDDAYDKLVERLLGSDECAEWLTLEWMDVARYADSHGLHADGSRTSWPWRDWVIDAFRENMPYDQFVTWQIAGDLLPDATREQVLATAFLRNHPMTGEGGVIDEEFRWNYVFDRVETVGTAVLGMTLQCCRCHDHKFDPVSQSEYFQFAAFFNNVRELGMTGDDGDYGPLLALPDATTEARQRALDRVLKESEAQLASMREARIDSPITAPTTIGGIETPEASRHLPFEQMQTIVVEDDDSEEPAEESRLDGASFVTARAPESFVEGVRGKAARVDGDYGFLELSDTGMVDVADPLSVSLWVRPEPEAAGAKAMQRSLLGNAGDKNQLWRGWEFFLDEERLLSLTLTSTLPAERILVKTLEPIELQRWTHVAFAYDGSGDASGAALYVDGERVPVTVLDDSLTRSIYPVEYKAGYPRDPKRRVQIGRSHRKYTGDNGAYVGSFDELRVFDSRLTDAEVATLHDLDAPEDRSLVVNALSVRQLREHALLRNDAEYADVYADRRSLLAMQVEMQTATPHVMVVQETPGLRETRILGRGEYTQPGDVVGPGTPAAVQEFPEGLPANRLGLAQWCFSGDNPLAARVAVNRYWQLLFGVGLVETPHDFGLQGSRPTHPELLDTLAVAFQESGWDLRALLSAIVRSETYKQSSSVAAWRADATASEGVVDAPTVDPSNQLLWRGPARRMKAEALRDSALAASGLLVSTVGGPSVKPYQPKGLWIEKSSFSQELMNYVPDEGDSLYRRSMYTFLRRTSPPPSMATFDAPNRSTCIVKREATNTPLQALVLLNDPQFVEAARVLAERVALAESAVESRIGEVFRRLTGRESTPGEAATLAELYESTLARYQTEPEAAERLLSVGAQERLTGEEHDAGEVAALAVIASTVMNYDAFYMER